MGEWHCDYCGEVYTDKPHECIEYKYYRLAGRHAKLLSAARTAAYAPWDEIEDALIALRKVLTDSQTLRHTTVPKWHEEEGGNLKEGG